MSSTPVETQAWDRPIRRTRRHTGVAAPRRSAPRRPGRRPTVEEAISAWLATYSYAPSTRLRAHQFLESKRARGWREQHGIVTIDQLSAAAAAAYVLYLRDRGAAPATVRKVKTLFCGLQRFCSETPGYEDGLQGGELQRMRLPRLVERIPEALTEEECVRLIAACADSPRNRLIVETFLLSGLRVSELCALTVDAVHLDSRPAYLHVIGTVHDPERPKNSAERHVVIDYDVHGFGRGYVSRLRRYIESVRGDSEYRELFLTRRANGDAATPLTTIGVQRMLTALEARTGIHCNPHKFRHTYATRCVDKGVPMFHLQDALGHRSLDMVRRYYTRNRHAQAEGFYRAFGATT